MRAFSLWQPWASLWLSPAKMHETRHWATKVRGEVAVHASKTFEGMTECDGALDDLLIKYYGPAWEDDFPFGALIGVVNLIDCVSTDEPDFTAQNATEDDIRCGNWSPKRFLFRRGDYRRFKTPIPYRGTQGFFTVPDSIIPPR